MRARFDSTVMYLDFDSLEEVREEQPDLDYYMNQYEEYIAANGVPVCDYKVHRHANQKLTGMQKFRIGIHRILKIIKSTKTKIHISDLLK